jgi:hypothetical protein
MMYAFWGSFPNSRGELDGDSIASVDFLWISIVGLAWVFGYWCFTEADKSVRSVFLATALSLGTSLAALFAAISVWFVGWRLLRPTNDLVHLMGTAAPVAFALAAALTLTVSFRAATRAWAATHSRARSRPQRTVLAIVAAPYSLLVLGWILAAAWRSFTTLP